MNADHRPKCSVCGREFSGGKAFCLVCMLRAAAAVDSGSGASFLGDTVDDTGRLEIALALEIATQVAAGLAAVHKKNRVHRDVKPSNIMVSLEKEGAVTAKIIDLGLAKAVNEPGTQTAISTLGFSLEQGLRNPIVAGSRSTETFILNTSIQDLH